MTVLQNIVMYSSISFQNAFEIFFFRNGFRVFEKQRCGAEFD
jgi:hypothetical protein